MSKNVYLSYLENYKIEDVEDSLNSAFYNLNLFSVVKPKMKVLVKVDVNSACVPDMAETTNPAVVRAVVNLLTNLGAICTVVDSPYKKYNVENLDNIYLTTGMLEVANQTKCTLNRNLTSFVKEIPNGKMLKSVYLLDVLNQYDAIVNVGKIKIKENFGYMGACSNLFGFVPGEMKTTICNRLNRVEDYENMLLDIYSVVQNKLLVNVLDGVVTLEAGDSPRMLSCLAVSENALNLDATILDILNISPKNSIIKVATERELYSAQNSYKVLGEKIEKFRITDFLIGKAELNSFLNGKPKINVDKNQKYVHINGKVCKGCEICSKICPTNAIVMKYDKNGELFAHINYNKCIYCFKCSTACPYSVVEIVEPLKYKKLIKEITKYNENKK